MELERRYTGKQLCPNAQLPVAAKTKLYEAGWVQIRTVFFWEILMLIFWEILVLFFIQLEIVMGLKFHLAAWTQIPPEDT